MNKTSLNIICSLPARDAPIAIFLADSDFWFFCKCDLPIPIFLDLDFLSKNYNWQYIQTKIYTFFDAKNYLHNKKLLNITIPPIWTKLQMFSHLNNSQIKAICH